MGNVAGFFFFSISAWEGKKSQEDLLACSLLGKNDAEHQRLSVAQDLLRKNTSVKGSLGAGSAVVLLWPAEWYRGRFWCLSWASVISVSTVVPTPVKRFGVFEFSVFILISSSGMFSVFHLSHPIKACLSLWMPASYLRLGPKNTRILLCVLTQILQPIHPYLFSNKHCLSFALSRTWSLVAPR